MNLETQLIPKEHIKEISLQLIVAFCKNGVIGHENKIPWHIPEDLKRFRDITKNGVVVMGRKTYESLPGGPLKNRINIVISRMSNMNPETSEMVIYVDMNNVFPILEDFAKNGRKIFIIGGNDIYRLFFDYCTIFHITVVDKAVEGDVVFPYDFGEFRFAHEERSYFEEKYTIVYKSDILYSKNENAKYQYYTFIRNYV